MIMGGRKVQDHLDPSPDEIERMIAEAAKTPEILKVECQSEDIEGVDVTWDGGLDILGLKKTPTTVFGRFWRWVKSFF